MRLFNFYLDDETKEAATERLTALGIDAKKGGLAATIRVLLRLFAEMPASQAPASQAPAPLHPELKYLIEQEYAYTTKKNKRSQL